MRQVTQKKWKAMLAITQATQGLHTTAVLLYSHQLDSELYAHALIRK